MTAVRIFLLLVCAAVSPARELLAQSLPPGWTFDDVGSPSLGGRAAFTGGAITVDGAGADIWGTADEFAFLHRRISGDATLVVRVSGIQGADAWAKAGLMIRESLDPGSRHAFAIASGANGLAFQRRVTTGASSAHTGGAGTLAPVWLKLERRSSTFTASSSADGVTWTTIGSDTIDMSSTVYAGLALTSHDRSALATAQFGDLQIDGAASLPPGWSSADIGTSVVPGAAAFANGWFAVRGAGDGIWSLSDQFTYVYQPVSGDVDIIAAAAYLQSAQPWGKAGLMVRASLDADAAHASLFASLSRGLAFQRRPAAALPTIHSTGGAGSAPVWLKLERRGSAVTAFRSGDGVSWAMIGSETLALPPLFYVGLAVTSHDAATAATALFTAVSITPAGPPPPVPLTTAVFIPSSDHDTPALTSYRLEIFAAGDDPSTAPPVSVRNLGKPAVVAGECRAGIAETIAALPPGSYVAAVSAIGPGGSSARVLSDAFSR